MIDRSPVQTNQVSSTSCRKPALEVRVTAGRRSYRLELALVRVGLWFSAAIALSSVLCGTSQAQGLGPVLTPSWSQQTPANSPSARISTSMAYDSAHQQVVLFGGGGNGDTWLWNGVNWKQANPATSPAPRGAQAMAYDPVHGQVVMFGGIQPNSATARLGDTWLWNGTNWTQASVTNGPPARDGEAMTYDAAHGQVVMFGGIDNNGSPLSDTWLWDGTTWTQANVSGPSPRYSPSMAYDSGTNQTLLFGGQYSGPRNDTWVWNGSTWTQQSLQVQPPARQAGGMAYDPGVGLLLFGGGSGNGYLNDTWLWSGTNWAQYTTMGGPSPRELLDNVAYDAATSQIVMFGGYNGNSVLGDTWNFGVPGNFNHVNVCAAGQTTPTPCSETVSFNYTVPAPLTFSTPQVLTQGASGLDFTLNALGTTCTGFVVGPSCIVSVTFTPTAPGSRSCAIRLTGLADNGSTVVTNTPIYGVGQAPAIAFGPGAQTVVNTGSFTLSRPLGVLADAAGNVFISDQVQAQVFEVSPSGAVTSLGSGLMNPLGMAEDGAGNLYVADNTLNEVVVIPAGCTTSSCQQTLGSGSIRAETGVAVDGAGDVFISDYTQGKVVESPVGCSISYCQIVVYNSPTGNGVYGVAVDAAGDVFVANNMTKTVVEIPVGCTTASCQVNVGSGWQEPDGVAVDAAGDVFVADALLGEVVEVPAGCVNASCQMVIASGIVPKAVSVDSAGNVFATDFNTQSVLKISRSQPPRLNFQTTAVGSISSDSPKPVRIQNIGNQTLNTIGYGLQVQFPYTIGALSDGSVFCSSSFSLVPGQGCSVGISFAPMTITGQFNASATLNDNALNSPGGQQDIATNGLAVAATSNFALSVTGSGSGTGTVTDSLGIIDCVTTLGVAAGACSGNYANGSQITLTAAVSGTTMFTGWGGACASSGTSLTCGVTITQAANVSASFVNQSFGSVAVCPAGVNTQATCTHTMPVTYNLPANTAVGAVRVVTQGATGLDFSAGSGGTCTGTVSGTCSVNVSFTPIAPGLRMGAVQLYDSNGNLVESTPIYGVGLEPEIAFGPGTQAVVNTTANYPLAMPKGVATDAAGDLFISDTTGAQVVKIAANGTVSTVGVGLAYPQGLAVDGAGNLYIADNNLNQVVEVPAGCASSSCQVIAGSGLRSQLGVAVDGPGNVYIGDFLDGKVAKFAANGGAQTIVYSPGGNSQPVGLATDAAGDLFIADFGVSQVVEIPAGCVSSGCAIQIGSGWSLPEGVAVDAAGDVFVADLGLAAVIEVPAGCASSACQITVASGIAAYGVAVDTRGTVFIPEPLASQVVGVVRFQAPALSFATTNVGSVSTDSAQTVTVQNIGNQPLVGSSVLSLNGNFSLGLQSNCGLLFPLAPGAICQDSFSFTPLSASFFLATGVFSNNSLNATGATQTVTLSGTGAINGVAALVSVPNVIGQAQAAAGAPLTSVGLAMGTVTTASSSTVAAGSVIDQSPEPGTQVNVGSAVSLQVSTGVAQPAVANPLVLENNYFVTGDYISAGVTLRGTGGAGGVATGNIVIPSYAASPSGGVPDGADVVDAFLYWESVENTPMASSTTAIFNGYSVPGQQIGDDIPNYTDGALTGTLRAYRAAVNAYLPVRADGNRIATGTYTVSLPDVGGSALPLTEGASLVMVYRVLSPNFPLKSVVLYDGAAVPAAGFSSAQVVQGFYDAVGGANGTGKSTNLFAAQGVWNSTSSTVALGSPYQYNAPLVPGNAYAAVILSTRVNNSDNDGILDAWKAGPGAGDFHAGQPGYYDAKTATWVGLPGAKTGQKDLFVQMDYMCGALLADGSCDPAQENLFPSPDFNGNDPLAMVQKAFTASGVQLHLQVGNAIPEDTCTDDLTTTPATLCQFPNQPGVVGWKNSLEFSKLWPRNLSACISGGDCTTRFPFGQKDSYHYVLFGHSLAIPAWNSRYGTLVSINVVNGVTTIVTSDRGTGISACPSRFTLEGVIGRPELNGIYNTTSCADTKTITLATPGVPNWSYPNNTLAEPVIGLTSGTVTSISGYSDLGGSDSAVTLGLWLTAPNQDMSKKANVLAGTLFHEIGHTLGLGHGGIYYDTPGSYVATFEANCKPNYQSVMNYLFQLDLVGPNQTIAFSNQTLNTLNENMAGGTTQLTDALGNPATFPTSAWYVPFTAGSTASPATRHCDGSPLTGDSAYRVDASIAPVTPPWQSPQDLSFTGVLQAQERGYNDIANLDLRQVGATSADFTSLASVFSFGSSSSPLNISSGGSATLGAGGTIDVGAGGEATLTNGGNVTLGGSGTVELDSGGDVTFGNGGDVSLPDGGTATPGSDGNITLGSGGRVTLGSGGRITLGSGGDITLNLGGLVTLGSGGRITLGSGGVVVIPSSGGSFLVDAGGRVTLGSGGSLAIGSGGDVTLGGAGIISLGSGGRVTLGSGGLVTLGSGGRITLGSGGRIALGSGGNVTLGSGGRITLGSGGRITLGSGGDVSLASGGTVTLGLGGSNALGGNVTLADGGSATVGSGGRITLGSGGSVTVNGSTSNVTVGAGGRITLGSGGTLTIGSGGTTVDLDAPGTFTSDGGIVTLLSAGRVTLGSGGRITLGSGGNVTLDLGGTIALGSGGRITLGSGGRITLGSGGRVTLGSGGVVSLGDTGSITLGSGSSTPLGSVPSTTGGSGGPPANELTYETANSVVRPPTSPTETITPAGVRITWQAPAFGVVQTYTISRSSNGASPMVIGSVSGVNGNPPATEFTDTNPDLMSKMVVYTISTTLVPDSSGAPRQSQPSPPAVVKNDQTIVLGPLPSSVVLGNAAPAVTATAMTGGTPNGLQVLFSASGSCVIGSQLLVGNVSSASVTVSTTGSCTISASQPGASMFNAANTVSGTFLVLQKGSGTLSQTIHFTTLPNAQYGGSFTPVAVSTAGLPVSFTASGPCTAGGSISGVGVCSITASAAGNGSYSAASLTQSFTIYPAVLKVTATNLTTSYGQTLPALTYNFSGFQKGDSASVVSGAPLLSTSATAASVVGSYPIAVATGTLAAANYSFLYVSGTLTVQPASQIITFTINPPASAVFNTSFVVAATNSGVTSHGVILTSAGACTNSGPTYTMTSGSGTCSVIANQGGNNNYGAAPTVTKIVNALPAAQTITFTTNPPVSAAYNSSFSVAAKGGGSGKAVTFTSAGVCINSGATFTMTNSVGTCSVIANQAGNNNYAAATLTKTVVATGPSITVSPASIDFGTVYLASISTRNITVTNSGTAPLTVSDPILSLVKGGNSNEFVAVNLCPKPLAAGKSCTVTIAFVAGPFYTPQNATLQIMSNAPGSPQPVALSAAVINPVAQVNPTSLSFGTVKHATSTTLSIKLSNTGTTVLNLNSIRVTGANTSSFVQTNTCGNSLAAGANCMLAVKFTPSTAGTFGATLTIVDNARIGTQTVSMSGTAN